MLICKLRKQSKPLSPTHGQPCEAVSLIADQEMSNKGGRRKEEMEERIKWKSYRYNEVGRFFASVLTATGYMKLDKTQSLYASGFFQETGIKPLFPMFQRDASAPKQQTGVRGQHGECAQQSDNCTQLQPLLR